MDTEANQNLSGTPTAPPPPQEVKVRTMASDLASMAASGGGLPQFENVKIAAKAPQKTPRSSSNNVIVIVTVIVALIILAAVAYFGYQALQKQNTTPPAPAAPQ